MQQSGKTALEHLAREAKKAESFFRGEVKAGGSARGLKHLLQEYKDQLEEFGEPLSAWRAAWTILSGTRESHPGLF